MTKTTKLVSVLLGLMLWGAAEAGEVTYVYTDLQGTPLMETDAQGNITARFEYTPYGVPVTSIGAVPDGPGYTGHVNDPETGLVYMQARYYDPMGRMLSVDPVRPVLGDVFGFNRYNYANNNPSRFTDPDGRQSRAAGKQLGRILHAAWVSRGDGKKFDAIMAEYKRQDRQNLNVALGLTEVGIVKDAIDITVETAKGGDATAQGEGAIAGEIAGQVAEKALARKIGEPAAKAVAAIAGQIVGGVVETASEQSQKKNSADGSASAPPEVPRSRPPPPPPVTDFYD